MSLVFQLLDFPKARTRVAPSEHKPRANILPEKMQLNDDVSFPHRLAETVIANRQIDNRQPVVSTMLLTYLGRLLRLLLVIHVSMLTNHLCGTPSATYSVTFLFQHLKAETSTDSVALIILRIFTLPWLHKTIDQNCKRQESSSTSQSML